MMRRFNQEMIMKFSSNFSNNSTDNSILDKPNIVVAELGLAEPQLVLCFLQF